LDSDNERNSDMPRVNEKSELTIEVDFNQCSPEGRLDMLNRLARLYEQPGAKIKLTLEFGDMDDLLEAADEIDEELSQRDPDIKVHYAGKFKDLGTLRQSGGTITPMERAGVSVERRPALARG